MLVLAAATAVALAPAADAAKRRGCAKRDSRTILATENVRVYVVGQINNDRSYYGCLRFTGRRTLLAEGTSSEAAGDRFAKFFQAYGQLVAFAAIQRVHALQSYEVATVDLRTGRTIRFDRGDAGVLDLRMARSGSLALLTSPTSPRLPTVSKIESGGRTVLDSGSDVDPHSLAVAKTRIYWMRGGVAQSAAIE
jgi:hypothetical protein